MAINQLLLGEFDHEMSNTRKTLERVPADKWDWKPHAKSGTLGWLAGHIATLPAFTVTTIQLTELEIAGSKTPKVANASELLPAFAKCRQEARDALAGVTDEQLRVTWTLKWNGKVLFSMPRYDVLRMSCFNHIIHHRAQLTTYLRALDVPVPALYGPSADEQM
ncbi:MAG TPA: DinB family protein [Candidatus Dormibacteraeota bacterium]|nr:DinB family protein [Candidatus Dormibacteraeota bacterium]